MEHSKASEKQTAILTEEIKSVVLEKHESENRDESKLQKFLACMDIHSSDAETGLIVFEFSKPKLVRN